MKTMTDREIEKKLTRNTIYSAKSDWLDGISDCLFSTINGGMKAVEDAVQLGCSHHKVTIENQCDVIIKKSYLDASGEWVYDNDKEFNVTITPKTLRRYMMLLKSTTNFVTEITLVYEIKEQSCRRKILHVDLRTRYINK